MKLRINVTSVKVFLLMLLTALPFLLKAAPAYSLQTWTVSLNETNSVFTNPVVLSLSPGTYIVDRIADIDVHDPPYNQWTVWSDELISTRCPPDSGACTECPEGDSMSGWFNSYVVMAPGETDFSVFMPYPAISNACLPTYPPAPPPSSYCKEVVTGGAAYFIRDVLVYPNPGDITTGPEYCALEAAMADDAAFPQGFKLTAPRDVRFGLPGTSDNHRGGITLRITLAVDAGEDQTICAGETATLGGSPTAAAGKGPFTYSWSPITYLSSATAANPTASPGSTAPSTSITYVVVVTDTGAGSCTGSDEMVLTICAKPEADAGEDKGVCQGGSEVLGPFDRATVNGNYRFSWTPTTFLDDPTLKNPTASTAADTPSQSITYTVVWTELDCNSCTGSDEMVLAIHENPDCTIYVDAAAADGIVEPGSTHTAWVETPGAGEKQISWTVQDIWGNDLIVGPADELTVTFKAPLEPTTIKISVALEDNNSCQCAFDPPLNVEGPDASSGILQVYRYIPTLAGWGLMGLVALLAGSGAWLVRRRKRK